MLRIGLLVSLYDLVYLLLGAHSLCIQSWRAIISLCIFHSMFDFIHYSTQQQTLLLSVKLLFDPAEPVMVGPIKVQGLFESRQVEVSEEFGRFMAGRVLNSRRILESLSKDAEDGEGQEVRCGPDQGLRSVA